MIHTGSEGWPQGWVPQNAAGNHPVLQLPRQVLREGRQAGHSGARHRRERPDQGHHNPRWGGPEADQGGVPEEEQRAAGARRRGGHLRRLREHARRAPGAGVMSHGVLVSFMIWWSGNKPGMRSCTWSCFFGSWYCCYSVHGSGQW